MHFCSKEEKLAPGQSYTVSPLSSQRTRQQETPVGWTAGAPASTIQQAKLPEPGGGRGSGNSTSARKQESPRVAEAVKVRDGLGALS